MNNCQRQRIQDITQRFETLLDGCEVQEKIESYPDGQVFVGWKFSYPDFWTGGSLFEIGMLSYVYENDNEFCESIASGVLAIKEGRVPFGRNRTANAG